MNIDLSYNLLTGQLPPLWTAYGGCGSQLDLRYNLLVRGC